MLFRSLESAEIIYKSHHPKDKRKSLFNLTQKGIDLVPILIEMIIWSKKYEPDTYAPEEFLELAKNNRDELIKNIQENLKEEQKVKLFCIR